jgi:hypothetical protein
MAAKKKEAKKAVSKSTEKAETIAELNKSTIKNGVKLKDVSETPVVDIIEAGGVKFEHKSPYLAEGIMEDPDNALGNETPEESNFAVDCSGEPGCCAEFIKEEFAIIGKSDSVALSVMHEDGGVELKEDGIYVDGELTKNPTKVYNALCAYSDAHYKGVKDVG